MEWWKLILCGFLLFLSGLVLCQSTFLGLLFMVGVGAVIYYFISEKEEGLPTYQELFSK